MRCLLRKVFTNPSSGGCSGKVTGNRVKVTFYTPIKCRFKDCKAWRELETALRVLIWAAHQRLITPFRHVDTNDQSQAFSSPSPLDSPSLRKYVNVTGGCLYSLQVYVSILCSRGRKSSWSVKKVIFLVANKLCRHKRLVSEFTSKILWFKVRDLVSYDR